MSGPPSGLLSAGLLLAAAFALSPLPSRGASGVELSEAARWLQGYLTLDTTNPPGGERAAAAYLARILHREGIATETLVTAEGRASLYARLEAAKPGVGSEGTPGEALLLLHHMDVVPAGAVSEWRYAPFAGTVAEGRLWGRGALDAKSLGIAHLAALVQLKRSGARLARDVVFLAVADEESGGGQGTFWLWEHHPEIFRGVSAVLNEGGANLAPSGRVGWWGIEVAQKRPLWLEIEAFGRGGHGSGLNPGSAVHRLIRALDRLLEMPPRWRVTKPVRDYLGALAPLHNEPYRSTLRDLDAAIGEDGPRKKLLPGMANLFLDSVQVTVLEGSDRINVVPETARARADVRLLPDTDAEEFLGRVQEALGDQVRATVILSSPSAPASPTDSELYRLAQRQLGEEGPVVPAFIGGFTDSRAFRERGIPAYGLSPFALGGEDLRGIHGVDERIPLDELDRGVERMRRLVTAWATAPSSDPGP